MDRDEEFEALVEQWDDLLFDFARVMQSGCCEQSDRRDLAVRFANLEHCLSKLTPREVP